MNYYEITHNYADNLGEASDTYFVKAKKEPTEAQVVKALLVDFEPEKGESIDIVQVFPPTIPT